MTPLTEQEIIKIALPFIRSHYKFRPRGEGNMDTRYNVSTNDGIIADGLISFTSESGEPFTVTVESAAQESKAEVLYTREYPLLNWDGLAFFSIALSGYYLYLSHHGVNLTKEIGSVPLIAGFIGCLLIGMFLFGIVLGWLPRYRYIYAIEQFKQYHATEQWIALGESVFEEDEASYFDELKVQCIRNGIGLVVVTQDDKVHILFTPSREAVVSNRKKVVFENASQIPFPLPQNNLLNKIKALGKYIPFIGKSRSSLDLSRYRSKNYKQIFLFSLGAITMLSVFFTEWQDQPIAYLDEYRFQQEQLDLAKTRTSEPTEYFIEEDTRIDSSLSSNYLDIEPSETSRPSTKAITNADDNNRAIDYSCERFYTFQGNLIAVQDAVYTSLKEANDRRTFLKEKGLPMNVVWLGCFNKNKNGYMVYYDLFYDNKDLAKRKAYEFSRSLRVYDIPHGQIKLRTIKRIQ